MHELFLDGREEPVIDEDAPHLAWRERSSIMERPQGQGAHRLGDGGVILTEE
jgi:hypothetical protein